MENVRIAVLDTHDLVLCHMDNSAPGALHYYDDELHMYLKGSASTFGFKVSADHEDSEHVVEGNKLSFVFNGKDYYFNIMKVNENETEIEVTAFSLSFELLNDSPEEYEAAAAMTFEEYMEIFDPEKCVEIGLNELSSITKKMGKFKEETLLSRIYSLAELFEVEVEFVPVLNNNYSLKKVVLNIYRAHSSKYQGMGKNRTDIVLRYGKGITGIRKASDITELFTAIRPYGRDGLTLESYWDMKKKDDSGNIEFEHLEGEKEIRAVQARDRFPSNLISKDRYITVTRKYDTNDQPSLYLDALKDLEEGCVPKVTYEIDGYFDTGIGDSVSVEDSEFNPPLYLTARVTEQIVSFTDVKRNKSVFSNIKEEKSQISSAMIEKMQEMIKESMMTKTTYKMTVDVAAIKWSQSDKSYTPEQINISAFSQTGNEKMVPYMAFFTIECLERGWYTDLEINRETLAYTPPLDRVPGAVRISMYEYDSYLSDEKILLDQLIVPVVIESTGSETEPERGASVLFSGIEGNDALYQIPNESILGETKLNDVILTYNGYLFGVTNVSKSNTFVRRIGKLGDTIESDVTRTAMIIPVSIAGDYTMTRIGYSYLLNTKVSPAPGDVLWTTDGMLFEVLSQGSSGVGVKYMMKVDSEGVDSRGAMLFYCSSDGDAVNTEYVYAYNITQGDNQIDIDDLILTANNMLYIVKSISSHYVYVEYLGTIY